MTCRAAACCVLALFVAGCSQEAAVRRHLENGDRLLAAGRANEAVIEFRNAVDRDDRSGVARFRLAEAYAAVGNPERAYREYIRAADLLPDDAAAQVKAATYLLIVGQYEDARTRVQRLLEKEPGNVEAQIILGNALAGLRDLEGAVAQVQEAIALDPNRSQTYTNLALLNVAQGKSEDARAAFERAVALDGASLPARLALANFEWAEGKAAAAEQALKAALEIDPDHALTNRALATFFIASGRPAEAEPYLRFVAESTDVGDAWFELADYYIFAGRTDDARRVLEPLTVEVATAAAASVRLAGLAYEEGQTRDAHARIDRLIEREPNGALALLLKARWRMLEGSPEEALGLATRAIAADPRMIAGHYVRGLLQVRTRRLGDAIKSFTEVLRLNPRAAVAQVQLSRLHLARNAVDTAVLFAEEAINNAPGSLEARLALVRAWMARDELTRARAQLGSLRAQVPQAAGVHSLEGSLHLLEEDTAAARAAFDRALQLDPASSEALTGITTIDVLRGDAALAWTRLRPLVQGATDPDLLFLAAKVLIVIGEHSAAEQLLRRAIDLDPLHPETLPLLGRLYAEQRRLEAARQEFEQLAKREPQNMGARIMSALVVHAQGNLAEAKRRYAEVLKLEPRAALVANNLASLYADEGENLDYAQQLAESAAEQLPAHPEVLDTLGWVYFQRQLHGQAILRFQQSVATAPENPLYHYHLGLAYTRNGEPERARTALQAALTLDPAFADAKRALAGVVE